MAVRQLKPMLASPQQSRCNVAIKPADPIAALLELTPQPLYVVQFLPQV